MIKFARYLFLVFTLTLILPLLCLFIHSNKQVQKMELDASHHVLDAISREICYNIENLLKIQTVTMMEKLYMPKMQNISKKEIIAIFPDAKVEIISDFPNERTY